MRQIIVSDEIYDFLMNLSKEIKTQDCRATRKPYFFQVQEDREIAVPDGCGDEVWVMDGEVCLRTEEDIREAVFDWKGWDSENKNHQKKYKQLASSDVDEILEENYRKVNISTEHKYDNCFFTEKACREHIRINGRNLTNPKTYLNHAFRNKEMEMLFKFLDELPKKIKPYEILNLIRILGDWETYIFKEGDEWHVTNEWLCGIFAGRSFVGNTEEEAADALINYLYEHIGHDSIVGREVTKSGFPDLEKVYRYITRE